MAMWLIPPGMVAPAEGGQRGAGRRHSRTSGREAGSFERDGMIRSVMYVSTEQAVFA